MTDVDGRRQDLQRTLREAQELLAAVEDVLPTGEHHDARTLRSRAELMARSTSTLRTLKTRASSSLLNVGFVGGFSSGKSFLISGLQRKLELREVPAPDGAVANQYVGILPSSPTPTTACPATIVPVADAVEEYGPRGKLRVRFVGSQEWTDIGINPTPAVIAAYAAASGSVDARRDEHWTKTVGEVEFLTTSYELPAKMYDLPGYGSPIQEHDDVVRSKMQEADAFVYVAKATETLSLSDLEQIGALYRHHEESEGKPVIWVLTAIDRAMDVGLDGRPNWQATLEQNNSYLREHFQRGGRPDDGFIGDGFIAVSPALEAQALSGTANDDIKGSRQSHLIAASRMPELRALLQRMIETDTGPKHLSRVAREAREALRPHVRLIAETLSTYREPIERLREQQRSVSARHRSLQQARATLEDSLSRMLRSSISEAAQPFQELADVLHKRLDDKARSTDFMKPKELNEIDVLKVQVLKDWLTAKDGPTTRWVTAHEIFMRKTFEQLRNDLSSESNFGDLTADLDIDQLTVPRTTRPPVGGRDIIQRAAAVTGLSGAVGTAALSVGTALGATVLVPLSAVTAAAAIVYGVIANQKGKVTAREALQNEWIAGLDTDADNVRRWFEGQAAVTGGEVIDRALNLIDGRLTELAQRLATVDERLDHPEQAELRNRADGLEPVVRSGERLMVALDVFVE